MSDRGRSPSGQSGPGSGRNSQAGSPARPAPLGFDPGRLTTVTRSGNTRMELPADAFLSVGDKDLFPARGNNFNTEGDNVEIEVNQYRMKKFDFNRKIYQYDVSTPM